MLAALSNQLTTLNRRHWPLDPSLTSWGLPCSQVLPWQQVRPSSGTLPPSFVGLIFTHLWSLILGVTFPGRPFLTRTSREIRCGFSLRDAEETCHYLFKFRLLGWIVSPRVARTTRAPSKHTVDAQKVLNLGDSTAVQWLGCCALTAKGLGFIPSQGTKIPHAARCSPPPKTLNLNTLLFQKWSSENRSNVK